MCLKSFSIKLNHNLVVKIYLYVLHPVYSVKVHKTVLNKSSNNYSIQLFQYTSKLHHIPTITPIFHQILLIFHKISPIFHQDPPIFHQFHQYPSRFNQYSTNVQYHSKFHQFFHSNKLIPATPPQFHQIPVVKELSPLIYQRLHVRSSSPR